MKRVFSLLMAALLLFSLAACGEVTMEDVIARSRKSLEDVSTVHCSAYTIMDLTVGEESAKSTMALEADMDNENNMFHIIMESSTADSDPTTLDIYMKNGDTIDYYLGTDSGWMKMEGVDPSLVGQVDGTNDVAEDFNFYYDTFLATADAKMSLETLDGTECYKLTAPVSLSSLEVAKKFSMGSVISQFIEDENDTELVEKILSAMGVINVTIYINCDDFMPYGFLVDMKPALKNLYGSLGGETALTVTAADVSAVYTDFNSVEPITVPDEALNGMDLTAALQQQAAQ